MANTKITALSENTTPATGDLLVLIDDPAGAPASNKLTIANLQASLDAVQSDQETGTSTTLFVTPAVQQYHPSSSKFWVRWTANSTTILSDYNVDSIADTAVGDADITITADFSGTSWCGVVNTLDATNGWDNEECQGSGFNAIAAGTAGVLCSTITDGGTAACSLTDPDSWSACGFGDI